MLTTETEHIFASKAQAFCRLVSARAGEDEAVVVTLPSEIDVTNVSVITAQPRAAMDSGASAVIADLTGTTFCDVAAARSMLCAHRYATARDVLFRVASSSAVVLRIFDVLEFSHHLAIYPSVTIALMPPRPNTSTAGPGSRQMR